MDLSYEEVIMEVGAFGVWQFRRIVLLWIPMLMCGTQFITTDFMVLEPKTLFCRYPGCNKHENIFVNGSVRENLAHYSRIFPNLSEYYGPKKSEMAAAMSIATPFCTAYVPNITPEGFCYWNDPKVETDIYYCGNKTILFGDQTITSLVSEFKLVCDNYYKKIIFCSVSGFGSFFGSILIAVIADSFGRRLALGLAMITMSLGALLETFMPSFAYVCIFTFLNSFGKWALFQVALVYLMEVIGFRKRFHTLYWISYNSVATITIFIPYSLGKILSSAVVQSLPNWRQFERWIALGTFTEILIIFFLPESPKWLLSKNKIKEAKAVLREIARVNGKREDFEIEGVVDPSTTFTNILMRFPRSCSHPSGLTGRLVQRNYRITKMFDPLIIQYTVALSLCWPMITFLRFGLENIGDIFEDTFTTNYIRSIIEISGLLLTAFFEGMMGRRCFLLMLLLCSAGAFFLISYETLGLYQKKFLIWFANFPTTSANVLIVLYTFTVIPACLSSITIGIFTALASIGEVLGPVFIDYVPYLTHNQEAAFFALCLAAIMGICVCYYLPETLGQHLPETMDDVVYLRHHGRKNCCSFVQYEDMEEEENQQYENNLEMREMSQEIGTSR